MAVGTLWNAIYQIRQFPGTIPEQRTLDYRVLFNCQVTYCLLMRVVCGVVWDGVEVWGGVECVRWCGVCEVVWGGVERVQG